MTRHEFVMLFLQCEDASAIVSLLMEQEGDLLKNHSRRWSQLVSRKSIRVGLGIIVLLGAVAIVSALTGGKVTSADNQIQSGYTGVKVPDFTLSAVRGGVVREPWLDHKPAVVFFFASWCPPCRAEIPKIAKYLNAHHLGDGRVSFVGLDGDTYESNALSFINKDHVSFPVGFNPSDSVIEDDFKINDFPDTEFVSAKGVIQHVHFGAITPAELVQGVEELLDANISAHA
jgi:thiol-disulfide isomerase/thioredoxin